MFKKITLLLLLGSWICSSTAAKALSPSPILTGVVSSQGEGQMEGVLVKAKRVDGIVTVTVVSDIKGRYGFPKDKLQPGKYQISIRAVGYDLMNPPTVDIASEKATELDLKLQKTKNLASQLSNTEWLMSFPGTPEEHSMIYNCVTCHSLTRIARSNFDSNGWDSWLQEMGTLGRIGRAKPEAWPSPMPHGPMFTKYLSSINLSSTEKWNYDLKTLPRPKGRATRVLITEYDLPNEDSQPHEIVVDAQGMVWYADFVRPYLYKFNPSTTEFKEYRLPDLKLDHPFGSNCLALDKKGNLFMVMLKQAGIAKFDPKTEQFTTWKFPSFDNPVAHAGCLSLPPDGNVWLEDTGTTLVHKLDVKTGQFTTIDPFPDQKGLSASERDAGYMGGSSTVKRHAMYGQESDSKGNLYIADIGAGNIERIDAETGKETFFPTPTPNSGPRRMDMDREDRLWFGEYYAGKIGLFDTKTTKFKEWAVPTPNAAPYDVGSDKNGEIWGGGMHTDLVYRLNPKTGEIVQYLLPTLNVNIRSLNAVDNRTSPVTIWVGETHTHKIAKVEPLN